MNAILEEGIVSVNFFFLITNVVDYQKHCGDLRYLQQNMRNSIFYHWGDSKASFTRKYMWGHPGSWAITWLIEWNLIQAVKRVFVLTVTWLLR